MIADVTGVEHLHRESAPLSLVGGELCGVKLVIQKTALAADEMGVKVIRLQAVDAGGGFADAAVGELEDRRRRCGILVFGEIFVLRSCRVRGHLLDLAAHAEQERVERMTARREQAAAAILLTGVPAVLPIPRADAVVVVDLGVVQVAEQALIDYRFGREKLAGVAALEAHATTDVSSTDGLADGGAIVERKRERLFKNEVLASLRRRDRMGLVLTRV